MKRLTLVLPLLALAACGPSTATNEPAPTGQRGDSGTTITSVALRNGVACAVMDGPETKALACNWSGPRQPATGVDPAGDRGTTITVVTVAGRECAVMDGQPGKALSCEGMS